MTTLPPSLTNQEAPVGSLPGLLSRSAGRGWYSKLRWGHRGSGVTYPQCSRAYLQRKARRRGFHGHPYPRRRVQRPVDLRRCSENVGRTRALGRSRGPMWRHIIGTPDCAEVATLPDCEQSWIVVIRRWLAEGQRVHAHVTVDHRERTAAIIGVKQPALGSEPLVPCPSRSYRQGPELLAGPRSITPSYRPVVRSAALWRTLCRDQRSNPQR